MITKKQKKERKVEKFYFPNLNDAIRKKGWTHSEFKDKAIKINKSPSYRAWSLAMKKEVGLTSTYINRGKIVIDALDFHSSVSKYEKCT
jgi:hypothetical protein